MVVLRDQIATMLTVLAVMCCSPVVAQKAGKTAEARRRMVQHVAEQGVKDRRVLAALQATPRHLFVSAAQRPNAYYDMALPIGSGQTISPPFIVAYMTQQLEPKPTDKVLEIGTGSGYQAAVLSPLVAKVYSIEIVESLGKRAAKTLAELGYKNVTTKVGDGFQGWAEHAPFDKIIVTCSPENIPKPLIEQLREGGKMVIPLGERFQQTLFLYRKVKGELKKQALEPTFFVPMTGKAEQLRLVKGDSGKPVLHNGDFEKTAFGDLPAGWYYIRHGKVEPDSQAPGGKNCLTFSNNVLGRWAQALQAVGIDGRKVREIEVSLWVRGRNVRSGPSAKHRSHVEMTFFDENRSPAGRRQLGPWTGTFDWTKKTSRLRVPVKARLSVFVVGLSGGTGELSFDRVEIKALDPQAK